MPREDVQAMLVESAKHYLREGAKTAACALIVAKGDATHAIALVERFTPADMDEHNVREAIQLGIHEADEEIHG